MSALLSWTNSNPSHVPAPVARDRGWRDLSMMADWVFSKRFRLLLKMLHKTKIVKPLEGAFYSALRNSMSLILNGLMEEVGTKKRGPKNEGIS